LEVVTKSIYPLNFCSGSYHVPGYSVDYFHKNSERKISVVIQLLGSAI